MPPSFSRYRLALIFFQGLIFVLLVYDRRQLVPCISFYSLFVDAILISVTSFPGVRAPYSQLSRGHRTQISRWQWHDHGTFSNESHDKGQRPVTQATFVHDPPTPWPYQNPGENTAQDGAHCDATPSTTTLCERSLR